jgi:hypothetical protein
MEFGQSVLEKLEIGESFLGENHGKLAHWRNLAPKIISEIYSSSIFEAMMTNDRPWEQMRHSFLFIPKLETL